MVHGRTLTMVAPTTLNWSGQVTGATQTIYDTLPFDWGLEVFDLRGLPSTGPQDPFSGWNITATATPFTGIADGATIPDTDMGSVLAFGGGDSTATATNVPGSSCATSVTCMPAITSLTNYPIFIPTSVPVPVTIYNAMPGTGTGTVQIGVGFPSPSTANPAVWSVTLPGDVTAEPYTSTITTTVAAAGP